MSRGFSDVSADTLRVEGILAALAIGAVVSYATLSAAIGRDVQNGAHHILDSARRRLLREKAMAFDCVPSVGVKRLGDTEKIAHGSGVLRGIRRKARRGMAVVLSVDDFDALNDDMKLKHNATAVVLGSVAALTGKPGQRRLTGKIAKAKALTEQEIKLIADSI